MTFQPIRTFPIRPEVKDLLAVGTTGYVGVCRDDSNCVLKWHRPTEEYNPKDTDCLREIEIEKKIYACLSQNPHHGIAKLVRTAPEGIYLERYRNGNVADYIKKVSEVTLETRLHWALQVTEAVSYLHDMGVIHYDLKPRNLLVDDSLHIRVCDFGGSSFKGSVPMVGPCTRYALPGQWDCPPTVQVDLFALGSLIYELIKNEPPFHDQPSDQVENLYMRNNFPNMEYMQCGDIIKKCWRQEYIAAQEVYEALRIETQQHLEGIRQLKTEPLANPNPLSSSHTICLPLRFEPCY